MVEEFGVGGEIFYGRGGELVSGDGWVLKGAKGGGRQLLVMTIFLAGLVVGADFLADVAAVEELEFLDLLGEFCWDLVLIFYGEVADAEARVYEAGSDDGSGGAGVYALGAVTADVGRWLGR